MQKLPITALIAATAFAGTAAAQDTIALRAGAAVTTAPKYEGSSEYRVLGLPIIAPATGDEPGRLQFRALDDVRLRALSFGGFEFGPSFGYRIGRDEDDGDRLRGMGDVDGGLTLGAYGAFRIGGLTASAGYGHQISGNDGGGLLRLDLETRHRVTDRVLLRGGVGTTWADDDHMQARFGVTAAQSLRSGLTRYEAEAGIKDVSVLAGATIDLDPRWALTLSARYARLVGDAADSPIVETENQFTGMVGLSYRFEAPNPFGWFGSFRR